MMVISSSPSQDHSYTSVDGEEEYPGPTALPPPCRTAKTNPQPHPPPTKKANHSPTSSVDEAFSDDSYDSDVTRYVSRVQSYRRCCNLSEIQESPTILLSYLANELRRLKMNILGHCLVAVQYFCIHTTTRPV